MNWTHWKREALYAWIVVKPLFIIVVAVLTLINLILIFNKSYL
jgi:hypothetical protein